MVEPIDKEPKEPTWIRDPTAEPRMALAIDSTVHNIHDVMTKLCAGESFHCEYCGAQFPLWPISELATHMLDTHSRDVTAPMAAGFALLSATTLGPAHQGWFGTQLTARVILRRRAYEMGLATTVERPAPPSRIVRPS